MDEKERNDFMRKVMCYDAQGRLLHSNCPHESLFGAAFSFLGCKERAMQIGRENGQPQAVGTTFGLLWGVDFVSQRQTMEVNTMTEVFACRKGSFPRTGTPSLIRKESFSASL